MAGRREGVEYQVEHAVLAGTDALLVLHDDAAPDFELAQLDVADVGEGAHERWRVLVAHEEGRRLEDVDAFAGHVALSWRREATPRVAVLRVQPDGTSAPAVEVASPTALASSSVASNPSFETPLLRLQQTSWTTPVRVVDLDLSGGPSDGEVLLPPPDPPCSAGTTPPTTSRSAPGPPRPTASACRSRWCAARRWPPPASRRRATSTGTAATRSASTPGSPRRGCRCSTAVSPSRSPTCAAAARWAAAGTTTAS